MVVPHVGFAHLAFGSGGSADLAYGSVPSFPQLPLTSLIPPDPVSMSIFPRPSPIRPVM
jgi:hypothetical protein